MNTKNYTALAVVGALAITGQVIAQVQISRDGRPERLFQPAKGLNPVDSQFVRDAIAANQFEIQAGRLAMQKSTDPFVTEFGKEMVTDHQMCLDELQNIAARKGITISGGMTDDMQHVLMHLENTSASNFNAAFQNAQLAGHSAFSMTCKAEVQNGHDDDIKGYAVKTLPDVDLHYRMLLIKQTEMGATKMEHNN